MTNTICGADCESCRLKSMCGGCRLTFGRPFGGACPLAECCKGHGSESCEDCPDGKCTYKEKLMDEINALHIKDLPEITELFAIAGAFVNVKFDLPNGQSIKLLEDDAIYLGTQVEKPGTKLRFGIAASNKNILVCEYAEGGAFPEIVLYKRR